MQAEALPLGMRCGVGNLPVLVKMQMLETLFMLNLQLKQNPCQELLPRRFNCCMLTWHLHVNNAALAAFGVMMWELATGATAFKDMHYGGFYTASVVEGLRPQVPAGMHADYAAVVQKVSLV
jgi:hypothetical protein